MKTQFACPECHGPAALARTPKNGMRAQFACPHCKGPTSIKTSRLVSATLREVNYQCRDVECSYSFVVQAEAVRSLSPSGKPNPSINIPLSPHATVQQRASAEQLAAVAWPRALCRQGYRQKGPGAVDACGCVWTKKIP